jgi:hypothetical protein
MREILKLAHMNRAQLIKKILDQEKSIKALMIERDEIDREFVELYTKVKLEEQRMQRKRDRYLAVLNGVNDEEVETRGDPEPSAEREGGDPVREAEGGCDVSGTRDVQGDAAGVDQPG